jgi:hypothetical protein
MSKLITLLIALGLGLWLIQTLVQILRAARDRAASRATYFAAATTLLENTQRQIQPTGFARIAGRYEGLRFDLQALPDTLTFRKLPALWVMVTITEPQPLAGEMHIMARANGQESFSTHAQMPMSVHLPPGFPPDCSLRCTDPAALPAPQVMARIAPLFSDPKVKEVVLSPKGIRLVILAEEGDRTNYLIFRDAELGRSPLAAHRLHPVLDALVDLHTAQKAPS